MVITTAFGSLTNVAKADESKKDTITVYVAAEGKNASGAAVSTDDTSKNPTGAAITSKIENAKKAQDVLAETIYNTTFNGGKKVPGIEDVNGLYAVFSLARAGFKAESFYNDVYEKMRYNLYFDKDILHVFSKNSE